MLAIVIPYYKFTFFEETLQSLANQTDKRFKVYIGDDASLEDPSSLLKKFKGNLDFNYYRFNKNLGSISLTKQWERCIELIEDEKWLMILGDDDYISNNFIEEFYKDINKINSLNINVVHFAVKVQMMDNQISELYCHPKIESSTDSFFRKFFKGSHGSLSEQIFRKEAYLKHGFRDFPLAWSSDDFAWLDFTDFGNIYGINKANAVFRMSSENISRSGYKGSIKNNTKFLLFKIIVELYLRRFNKKQRLSLLLHFEKLYYRNYKVSFFFWIKMVYYFLSENEYKQIKFCSKRAIRNLISKYR